MKDRNGNEQPWNVRRKFMFVVSAFCMGVITYVLYKELNTAPAEAAVTMAFLTLTGIIGSYVFGAVWQDTSTEKNNIRSMPLPTIRDK